MLRLIGEAAAGSGLSVDTIRYYDSLGLLFSPERDRAGRRVFDEDSVRWLIFLRKMRETGKPLTQLGDYLRHRRNGADGVAGVLEVPRAHQATMLAARLDRPYSSGWTHQVRR